MEVTEERRGSHGEINERISSHLQELIRKKGIKKSQLADKAGISISNLYSILRGETAPTVYTLSQLCIALDVTLTSFIEKIDITDMGTDQKGKVLGFPELSERDKKILEAILEAMIKYE